jgi:hypothetical protein
MDQVSSSSKYYRNGYAKTTNTIPDGLARKPLELATSKCRPG